MTYVFTIEIHRNDGASGAGQEIRCTSANCSWTWIRGIKDWRYRHVKMVERMIGEKYGTGGSEGAGYLKSTLFKPFFPDLWAIRTELQMR